jgi:hypothetical protein
MYENDDSNDPIERLRTAGFELELFTDEQLELLTELDGEELTVLLEIKERLGDVRPEVEAHGGGEQPMTIGGLLF